MHIVYFHILKLLVFHIKNAFEGWKLQYWFCFLNLSQLLYIEGSLFQQPYCWQVVGENKPLTCRSPYFLQGSILKRTEVSWFWQLFWLTVIVSKTSLWGDKFHKCKNCMFILQVHNHTYKTDDFESFIFTHYFSMIGKGILKGCLIWELDTNTHGSFKFWTWDIDNTFQACFQNGKKFSAEIYLQLRKCC